MSSFCCYNEMVMPEQVIATFESNMISMLQAQVPALATEVSKMQMQGEGSRHGLVEGGMPCDGSLMSFLSHFIDDLFVSKRSSSLEKDKDETTSELFKTPVEKSSNQHAIIQD